MRALSIRQPWAELILSGKKAYELRSWRTPVRGRIWIHAARRVERDFLPSSELADANLVLGALVGTVEIVDCVPFTSLIAVEMQNAGAFFGDATAAEGFAWRLASPRRLSRPIPYRGTLGLFLIPTDFETEL